MAQPKQMWVIIALSTLIAGPAFAQQSDDGSLRIKRKNAYNSFMLSLINKDRQSEGAAPVEESAALSKLAQSYAEYLLKTGHFSHIDLKGRNPQDRAHALGIRTGVAENLAYQMSSTDSVNDLLKAAQKDMMSEPRGVFNHRHNITKDTHKFVGIGVAQANDKVVLVQEFSDQRP